MPTLETVLDRDEKTGEYAVPSSYNPRENKLHDGTSAVYSNQSARPGLLYSNLYSQSNSNQADDGIPSRYAAAELSRLDMPPTMEKIDLYDPQEHIYDTVKSQ